MTKKNMTLDEMMDLVKLLKPLLKNNASNSEMLEVLIQNDWQQFTQVKNPLGKLRDTLMSVKFEEAWDLLEEKEKNVTQAEEKADKDVNYSEPDITCQNVKKNKDGSITKEVNIITPEGEIDVNDEVAVMKALGYDPRAFKLISANCRRGSWNMLSKANGGEPIDLYSFRLTGSVKPLEPEKGEVSLAMAQEALLNVVSKQEKPIVYTRKKIFGEKKVAIVNIADLHLGKLAWDKECGESYDHKIAVRRFNEIISGSIDRLKKEENVEKIVFFWSQDFFHFDNMSQTTTAGTFQQTDLRWQKMFMVGVELLIKAIYSLKEIADVYTFYVRSNHDEQAGFYAATVLGAKFNEDKQVTVDLSATPRKYVEFGVNLLGFAHGDKEGKRLPGLMSIEAPEAWGRTKNREFFLGHFHSQRVYEESGVICRHLSAPCGTDAWHNQMGFIGAQKGAQMFIRGESTGQIAEYYIPVVD